MAPRPSATLLFVILLTTSAVGMGAFAVVHPGPELTPPRSPVPDEGGLDDLTAFRSPSHFQEYVDRGRQLAGSGVNRIGRPVALQAEPGAMEAGDSAYTGQSSPTRIGTTNVQVDALGEPDLVKTDGRMFYYSQGRMRQVRVEWTTDEDRRRSPSPGPGTHVIDPSTPTAPRTVAHVNATGQLVHAGDRLVVLGHDNITAYDVSNPSNPKQVWSRPLDDRLVTARERDGTIYLVTSTPVGDRGCPIAPIGDSAAVACTDILRPRAQIPVEATYSVFSLDATDGQVLDSISFVGTGRNAVVYMAPDSVYVTYTKTRPHGTLMAEFLLTVFEPTPVRVESRIRQIQSYDISPASKAREITRAVDGWLQSLPEAERREVRTRLHDEFRAYLTERQRNLTRTAVVKIGVIDSGLAVDATTTVPGRPLNQFSMSQFDGMLRITTTIPGVGDTESVADLYVLDAATLAELGHERGMGEGQRVYAVRYVNDTAYVITFRQVDPLHVVDLSTPTDPTEVGTLKLPGFSTYLHPIDDDTILGVGEEDGDVKAVLFDVSDPTTPTVADAMRLDARWSAIRRTHHAFTIDRKHGVAFLPAGGKGVVVDYTNQSLERITTVRTHEPVQRARYVDDYLYVFAGDEIVVLDERDWKRVTTLRLAAG